jgi:hypothetical protein
LVYATFPESAHRELEELNPQDVIDLKLATNQQSNLQ